MQTRSRKTTGKRDSQPVFRDVGGSVCNVPRGRIEAVICGAPGSGKSALVSHLVEQLSPVVVVDLDELLEPGGSLLGVPVAGPDGAENWELYEALWERVFELIRRAGHSIVVLSQIPAPPASPEELVDAQWILLDCPDAVRRRRLAERGWSADRIEDALHAAAVGREFVSERLDAGADGPEVVSRTLAHQIKQSR